MRERLESEGVSGDDLEQAVREAIGDGIDHYLDEMFNFVEMSNLNNPKGRVPRACPWVNA